MPEANPQCEQCGAPLPPNALEGLCPFCVTQGLFGLFDEGEESEAYQEEIGSIGGYELLEEIGEGGFAIVYRAHQSGEVRREVALKVIKKGMDTRQVIARFEAERQAVAMMDHADIATVFDAGTTDDGRPFFVMELVEGQTVTGFCRDLELRARLELMVRICNAVEHAHRRGIIHRDLKPNNLLVSSDGSQLKVIDFGIAKATEHLLTESTLVTAGGQLLGTPGYMSPEQATLGRADVDTRTDVYSLGILLYEIISGRPAWSRETLAEMPVEEMLRTVREQDPPPPSRFAPDLPADLDWITARATAKERERRYGSAAEFAADLQRFLDGDAVEARPPSLRYRLGKFMGRHRVAVVAGLLVALAVIGGVVASTIFAIQAEKRRAETAAAKDETRRNFSKADLGMARAAAEVGNYSEAVAYLCRSLRTDPENSAAAQTLVHELVYRGLPQPAAEPHSIGRGAESLHALAGGQLLVLEVGGTARLWRIEENQFSPMDIELPPRIQQVFAKRGGEHFALRTADGWAVFHLGDELAPLVANMAPSANQVELTHDGTVLVAFLEGEIAGYATSSGDELWRWASGGTGVTAAACAPERDYSAVGLADGTIIVLNSRSGRELQRIRLPGAASPVAGIAIVKSYLVAFSQGATSAHRFRLGRDAPPEELVHNQPITEVEISSDGKRTAVAGATSTRLFEGGEEGARLEVKHHSGMAFDFANETLIVQSSKNQVELFDSETGDRLSLPLEHARSLVGSSAMPSGLATVTETGTLHLWRAGRSFPQLPRFEHGDSPYAMVAFVPPGDSITTIEVGGTMGTFMVETGFEASFYSDKPFLAPVAFADLTRTNIAIVIPDPPPFEDWKTAEIEFYAIKALQFERVGVPIKRVGGQQARLTDDGGLMVVGNWDGEVTLYSTADGNSLHTWNFSVDDRGITWVRISPDGGHAVVASVENSVSILELSAPYGRKRRFPRRLGLQLRHQPRWQSSCNRIHG